AARGARVAPVPRAGAEALRRLLRRARAQVPLAAARAAGGGAAHAHARGARDGPRGGAPARGRMDLQPVPRDRPARVRAARLPSAPAHTAGRGRSMSAAGAQPRVLDSIPSPQAPGTISK